VEKEDRWATILATPIIEPKRYGNPISRELRQYEKEQ
jgi:hypothetical protein